MDRSWKTDPRDGVWTIERDRDDVRVFEIDLAPMGLNGTLNATVLAPVSESDASNLVISNIVTTVAPSLVFKATGAGALVTFRVTDTVGQSQDLTLRFRAV